MSIRKTLPLLFFVFLTLVSRPNFGQQYDSTYGKPLIVLVETNPWLMVVGSDVPSFALYEKGRIIYQTIEDEHATMYEMTLTQEALQKVIRSFSIPDTIYTLQDYIEATQGTDQPWNFLMLNLNQKKTIGIYGRLNIEEVRKKTPAAFLTVYDNIKNYKPSDAKAWLPKKIEVMFWDYGYAPNKRSWIKGFPDLDSPSTVKRANDSYSVFIDQSNFDEFLKYFSTMGEKEAVEINGKKMAVAYRLPFPNIR